MKATQFLTLFLLFFSLTLTGRSSKQNYQADGNMTKTQKYMLQEKQKFKKAQRYVEGGTHFTDYTFTVSQKEEFIINLPISQQVVLKVYTYIMQQNVYTRPQNIDQQKPIRLSIFQNNHNVISIRDFYFQQIAVFEGHADATYLLRFTNSGSQKLIMLSLKKLTQDSHVEQIVQKSQADVQYRRSKRLYQQLQLVLNSFQRYSTLNFLAVKSVLTSVNLYYYWEILEIIITVLVCILQLCMIKKICSDKSIV